MRKKPDSLDDLEWIEQATWLELREAIRTESPESSLFQGATGTAFWKRFHDLTQELYGDESME